MKFKELLHLMPHKEKIAVWFGEEQKWITKSNYRWSKDVQLGDEEIGFMQIAIQQVQKRTLDELQAIVMDEPSEAIFLENDNSLGIISFEKVLKVILKKKDTQ